MTLIYDEFLILELERIVICERFIWHN